MSDLWYEDPNTGPTGPMAHARFSWVPSTFSAFGWVAWPQGWYEPSLDLLYPLGPSGYATRRYVRSPIYTTHLAWEAPWSRTNHTAADSSHRGRCAAH